MAILDEAMPIHPVNGKHTYDNGEYPISQDAGEVQHYTLRALELVTKWIDCARYDSTRTGPWESSAQLAKACTEPPYDYASPSSKGINEDDIFSILEQTLHDSVHPWTRRFLDKLYSAPTTLSPAIELIMASLNVSTAVTSAAPALCLAEEIIVEQLVDLCDWDPDIADGLTMPGGSSSNVLTVQTALGNAFPSFKQGGIVGVVSDLVSMHGRKGRAARPVLLTSEQSHYSLEKSALACGLGLDSVIKIKCDEQGRMDLIHLEEILKKLMSDLEGNDNRIAGYPFFINATSGTTILGAFDDIQGIIDLARKYQKQPPIWVHVDGSWGGPVIFSRRSSHLVAGIEDADSLTINPHKILNVTQQCSFALFKEGHKLGVNVTGAKYLFHGNQSKKPTRQYMRDNPAAKTMGCARRGDAFKFYIEWLRQGTEGLEEHVERGIDHARRVATIIKDKHSDGLELSQATPEPIFLQVCFRSKPIASVEESIDSFVEAYASETKTDKGIVRNRVLSHCTDHIHSRLKSLGKYKVDKAPIHYPSNAGYYIRLVTHPNTPFHIFEELLIEIDRIGQAYFHNLSGEINQNKSSKALKQIIESSK